jgi:hypothetical protein
MDEVTVCMRWSNAWRAGHVAFIDGYPSGPPFTGNLVPVKGAPDGEGVKFVDGFANFTLGADMGSGMVSVQSIDSNRSIRPVWSPAWQARLS